MVMGLEKAQVLLENSSYDEVENES